MNYKTVYRLIAKQEMHPKKSMANVLKFTVHALQNFQFIIIANFTA